MCLPPNAEFELKVTHPLELNSLSKWTKVNAISDLDSDTVGGKYFYDATTGFVLNTIFYSYSLNANSRTFPKGHLYITNQYLQRKASFSH